MSVTVAVTAVVETGSDAALSQRLVGGLCVYECCYVVGMQQQYLASTVNAVSAS